MFRYRIYTSAGEELGEASYAMQIQAGETIHYGGSTRYLVISVLPMPDQSPLTGALEVDPVE